MVDKASVYRVGEVTITRIQEIEVQGIPADSLIPDWNPADVAPYEKELVPVCVDATRIHIGLSNHSWLVQTPLHTILIDTGVGNEKRRADPMFDRLRTPYLQRLAEQGVLPEDVDYVLMTHLHMDHVGWNTYLSKGEWLPTFPNARYFLSRREKEHYASLLGTIGPEAPTVQHYVDSVLPILSQAEFVDVEGGEIFDGLSYLPTPGHSINHMSIKLQSKNEQAIFSGDVFHHPMQVARPAWSSVYSENRALGEKSRLKILELAASSHATVFTTHTPGSSAGQVIRQGDAFAWCFF